MHRIVKAGLCMLFGFCFYCYAQDNSSIKQFTDMNQNEDDIQSVVELIDDNACEKFPNETDQTKRNKLMNDCEKLKQANNE